MTNNFSIIRPLIKFTEPGDFYFLQILKRRKDNPGQTGDVIVIDNYFIYSLETFDSLEERIIDQCERNNARAYIRLNRRNAKKVAMSALKKTVDYIASEDYRAVKNAYISACGDTHSDSEKKWIVDCDNLTESELEPIKTFIDQIPPISGTKIYTQLATRNGWHLITKPFNVMTFKARYPNIDLHKDNPTILYCK